MTIFVAEPRQSNAMKRPERLHPAYQPGGLHYLLSDLIADHPEAIYFSDDPEADFGPFVSDLVAVEAMLPAEPHVVLKTSDWETVQRVVRAFLPALEVFEPETVEALNSMKMTPLEVSGS